MTVRAVEGGVPIVLTAPLTEIIDHAGYFIQMSMASLPIWLEGIINKKYPKWRDVEYNDDGSARSMPAGIRVLETSLLRRFPASDVVCCYPDDLDKFIGPNTRVVAVSTHNPLGVTFAAGVYTSIFGSSRMPINSHYSRELFAKIKGNAHRDTFKVIVGGSGGWQIDQTNSYEDLSVDCIVEGTLLLELKSVKQLLPIHTAQVLTYLKLLGLKHGIIMNFNSRRLVDGLKSLLL